MENAKTPENDIEQGTTSSTGLGAGSQAEVATNAELRRLGSRNPPGIREDIDLVEGRRRRGSTVSSARTRYEIATQELQEQLDDFDDSP